MAILSNGIVLTQHKEPAFSRPLVRFVNPQTDALTHDFEAGAEPNADEIIEIAKAAQIVDERDGKMLYRKLLRAKGKAVAVICDAVDDEPYVSSKIVPLMQLSDQLLDGIGLCRQAAGTDNTWIVVYRMGVDLETPVPRSIGGLNVTTLQGGYPAPALSARIQTPPGRRLTVGAGALVHLHRAVRYAKRHSTAFITVAGNCIANPMNLEASIGMRVQQVLERCGLAAEPSRVVCGGPMTGIAILDTEKTLITYTTRAVLAFRDNEKDRRYNCIGCSRCVQVCPAGLNPMYLYRFMENSYYANLRPFDAHLCTGCGTCSYICPSRLAVSAAAMRAAQYARDHFIAEEDSDDADA